MSWCNYWNCECLHTPSFIDGECTAYCIEEKEEEEEQDDIEN